MERCREPLSRHRPTAKGAQPPHLIETTRPMAVEEFLLLLEGALGRVPRDLHVSRMFSSLVVISEGRIIALTRPYMEYCPLAASLQKRRASNEPSCVVEEICQAVATKIDRLGHYRGQRELCTRHLAIPFGASEMMMRALEKGVVDAAVVACEGAGTVVTSSPELVQGIGARMNGLFFTTPIPEVIRRIRAAGGNVACPGTARIEQASGLVAASAQGSRRIVVTVNAFGGDDLASLRARASDLGSDATILAICTTGIDATRAEELAANADLVWACASGEVRRTCGPAARIQVAERIPVFVMTTRGVRFLAAYATRPSTLESLDPGRQYLISQRIEGRVVGLGKVPMRLSVADSLPRLSPDSPRVNVT